MELLVILVLSLVHQSFGGGQVVDETVDVDNSAKNNYGTINNYGPHYAASITNLENSDACKNKIQISHNVNDGIKDEFTVPCANSNRNCKYEGEEVLVGSPDENFCAFAMLKMPNVIVVIQDGLCLKRIYASTAVSDEEIIKNGDCKVIKEKIRNIEAKLKTRNLMKTPEVTAEITALENDLENKLNEVIPAAITHSSHLTPTTSASGETASQSTTQTNPAGTTNNYFGQHYAASISNLENSDTCEEKIQISHNVNDGIKDEFIVPCGNPNRNCNYKGEEVLVGSPDDNFCAFSMLKFPKIMMVIQDGMCKKRTYTGSTVSEEVILKKVDCGVIKEKINKIEAKLKSRSFNGTPKITAEITVLENDLGSKLNHVVPAAVTHSSQLTTNVI